MFLKRRQYLWLICDIFLCLAVLISCQKKDRWIGQYETTVVRDQETSVISLELKPDGTGSLADGEDEVSVKWEIRGEAIWLHTKSGGIIAGRTKGNLLELELPGLGNHVFTRFEE